MVRIGGGVNLAHTQGMIHFIPWSVPLKMHNKNIGWNVAPSLHVRDISTPKIKEWFISNSPNQRYVQNIARVESLGKRKGYAGKRNCSLLLGNSVLFANASDKVVYS